MPKSSDASRASSIQRASRIGDSPDASVPELLFVYGTLRREGAARRLLHGAACLGAARYPGRLYDLGDYPGATPSDAPGDVVHGELYALAPQGAASWLARLDRYEGPEFRRQRARVSLSGGGFRECWIYVYTGALAGRRRIASGDYLG